MDNNKGFTTLEMILVIFLLGMVIKYILPSLNTNIKLNKDNIIRNNQNYIYSNIIETMKVSKKNNKNIDLYDIDFMYLFRKFKTCDYYTETLEIYIENYKYILKIEKENMLDNFWKIKLEVKDNMEVINNEESVEFLLRK